MRPDTGTRSQVAGWDETDEFRPFTGAAAGAALETGADGASGETGELRERDWEGSDLTTFARLRFVEGEGYDTERYEAQPESESELRSPKAEYQLEDSESGDPFAPELEVDEQGLAEAEDELEGDAESDPFAPEFEAEAEEQLEGDTESDPFAPEFEADEQGLAEAEDEFEVANSFAPELLADEQSLAEELGEDEFSRETVTYPSGESLPVVSGPDSSEADEYWDPNRTKVMLVETAAGQAHKHLSRSFTVAELARSGSHRFEKARIDPRLVKCIQAIRDRVGRPVRVNSGYRSWGYNKQLYRGRNQKPTRSRHCSGQAVDVTVDGMSGLDVAKVAVDACGDKIGVGIDRSYAHVDVRGTWARWTYPGLGGKQARQRAIAELEAHRRRRVSAPPTPGPTNPAPAAPPISAAVPPLGGEPVPPGFRRERKGRGLARYGGGRLDETLLRLRLHRSLAITDDEIDTLQRIANVESSKLLNAINTWDDAVVSLGFMQLTLKWGELQNWIARAPAAFARYGIALDESRTYSWGEKNRQTAIRGAADKDELRWGGWAARFYRAGGDEVVILAEVELAREILRKHVSRLQRFVREIPSGFDRWSHHYRASAHLRGMFHEGYNNRPAYALRAAASALRSSEAGAPTGRFVEAYRDALVAAYGAEAQKAQNIVAKTAEGARLGSPADAPLATKAPSETAPRAPLVAPPEGASEIAPFAVQSSFGYRTDGGRRRSPVYGIVVHTTGGGPATKAAANAAAKRGCQTAIDCALWYYRHGAGGYPHYVIDFDGTVHATCPESHIAWHAGWTAKTGGRDRWRGWSPPSWWARVWGSSKTPLDLIPDDASSPNSRHLGVELLGAAKGGSYTAPQYAALARLVTDIEERHQLGLERAPSSRLLGHEDVNPLTGEGGRANARGGWDPGAHRVEGAAPVFSWDRLWTLVRIERMQRQRSSMRRAAKEDGEGPFLTQAWA